jgi:CMP-N,N'-diacetyllegionaminic acid synthase
MKYKDHEIYSKYASECEEKVVGFVPARGGSKAITDKNLIMLAGYPLVAHAILSLKVAGIKDVYVSTDSKRIADVAKTYGAQVISRPIELAGDNSPTEHAIKHFISIIQCDVIAMRQCTSPLLEPVHISHAINRLLVDGLDSIFTAVKTTSCDMLLWNKQLRPVNYNPKNRSMRQNRLRYLYIETGGLYVFRRSSFIRSNCRISDRNKEIQEVPYAQSFEIDDDKDYGLIKRIMER